MIFSINQAPTTLPSGTILERPREILMLWEYHRLSVDGPNVEAALHDLGRNGWELVAVIPETRIFYGFQCFLKRPLAETPASSNDRASEPKRLDPYVASRPSALVRSPRDGDAPESLARMSWKR